MPDFYDMTTTELIRWLLDNTEKFHVERKCGRTTVVVTVFNREHQTEHKFDTSLPTYWSALVYASERVWHLLNGKYV